MKEILITSSALIGVVLLIRWLFRGKVSQKMIYAAWLLVALRLLVPIQFGELDFSILTAAKPMTEAITQVSDQQIAGVTDKEAFQQVLGEFIENDLEVFTPEVQNQIQSAIDDDIPSDEIADIIDREFFDDEIFIPEAQEQAQQLVTQTASPITLGQIATLIWIVGIVVMAVWFTIVNLRHSRKLRIGAVKLDCSSSIPVYATEQAASPCLVGLFKPVIYLTPESIEVSEHMQHILTHELTHYAHKDHIWSLVRCICLCVYWFDPLVWIAAYLSRQDCEMACDEGAMKQLSPEDRLVYGKTLLSVVTQSAAPGKLLHTATSMSETKKHLKERIRFIARKPKISIVATISLLLVCAIAVGCASAGPTGDSTVETDPPIEPNRWEISEELKSQIKQEYVVYPTFSKHTCTAEDVNLIVVSHVESGYALIVGCKCSSITLDCSWTDLWGNCFCDYDFFMPNGWYMTLYKDGDFVLMETASSFGQISKEEMKFVWSDYYAQFPAAWDFYKQCYPDGSPDRLEEQMLTQYHEIIKFLDKYDPSDPSRSTVHDYEDHQEYRAQTALRFCYQWLKETKEVDEWTEYCIQHWADGYEYNRQTLLRNFSVIKDVRLQAVRYENDPNHGSRWENTHEWHYDNQGRLNHEQLDQQDHFSMLQYIPVDFQSGDDYTLYYDNTGKISRIGGQSGSIIYIPNYDSSGRISSMTVQVDGQVRLIQYTYDGANRMIRLEISGSTLPSSNYLIEYSYDDAGHLIKRVQSYFDRDYYDTTQKIYRQKIMEYRYSRKNVLETATYIEQRIEGAVIRENQGEYTFSYDENGRMVRYDIAYYDGVTEYVEITYGDFLYYPA